MLWIEYLLLSIMILLGCLCSWSDCQRGIIPNKLVAFAFVFILAIQITYCYFYSSWYLGMWLICMGIADALALGLYFSGMWAAGDAKLFILMFLCLPNGLLSPENLSTGIIPFLFIFTIAFLWLVIDTLYLVFTKAERFSTRSFSLYRLRDIFFLYVEISAIQAVCTYFFQDYIENNNLLFSILLIVFSFFYARNAVMKKLITMCCFLLILIIMMLLGSWEIVFAPWWVYAITLFALLFSHFSSAYNYKRIPTSSVLPGMILSSSSVILFMNSRVQGLPIDASESMAARITKTESDAIKRWEKSVTGESSIVIVRKIPFAVFISLGFVLWCLLLSYDIGGVV